MKSAWDRVKFRVSRWHDVVPEAGDELLTRTGRRYLVLSATEKSVTCLVLPKDSAPATGKVFWWMWDSRKRTT